MPTNDQNVASGSRSLSTALPNATDSLRAAIARNLSLWKELEDHPARFRVLTGERTTGPLHVGHYFGSLANRVRIQDMGIDMFLVLVDYQAITDRDANERLRSNVESILLDYLSIGIDPQVSTIFCHSMVPPLNQLLLPFLSVITMSELQRNPTVKDEIATSGKQSVSGLMMTYPVHQAADILFCKGNIVPVGKDQLPHLDIARLIARRINNLYFGGETYFPEPEPLLSEAPLLLGLDGRKMGKSLDNAIYLGMTENETEQRIKRAKTDSDPYITYDPQGRPEVSNLVLLTALCTGQRPESVAEEIGPRGAGEIKRRLTQAVNEKFRDIRLRRRELAGDMDAVWHILREGVERANEVARDTLGDLRDDMGMRYFS